MLNGFGFSSVSTPVINKRHVSGAPSAPEFLGADMNVGGTNASLQNISWSDGTEWIKFRAFDNTTGVHRESLPITHPTNNIGIASLVVGYSYTLQYWIEGMIDWVNATFVGGTPATWTQPAKTAPIDYPIDPGN